MLSGISFRDRLVINRSRFDGGIGRGIVFVSLSFQVVHRFVFSFFRGGRSVLLLLVTHLPCNHFRIRFDELGDLVDDFMIEFVHEHYFVS